MKTHRNLRTHTRRRKGSGPKTYYFYDMRAHGKEDIPLGCDEAEALRRWADIDAELPRQKPRLPALVRDTPYGSLPTWAKDMYSRAKSRSRERGWPFVLTRDEFAEVVRRSPVCAVTGAVFEFDGSRNPLSPSIDRIDCSRGYDADNIRIVTLCANIAMSNWGESALASLGSKSVPQVPLSSS